MTAATWPNDIYEALRTLEVRQVAYVPDAGHTRLIEACIANQDMATIPLTTEEEGIALLGGAWLGGDRGVLLMQSSGVGNCINMLSLTQVCRFPLLMIVTMRGEAGEKNAWQNPMGRAVAGMLELAGVAVRRVEKPEDAGSMVLQSGQNVFSQSSACALLIAQQVIGIKHFED